MKSPLDNLLAKYTLESADACWQALREITQEIALLGLWRGKFFEHAAFYGGTALRIVHGLPRFSEDLDFSLLNPDQLFRLTPYLHYLQEELQAFGFEVSIDDRSDRNASAIESAFAKGSTRKSFLIMGVSESLIECIAREQQLKIKFEIDTDPPPDFGTEAKFLYLPQPFSVRIFDTPSLFAGKLHAVLARNWKNRVKGRDWYDMVWFVTKGTSASLAHLKARLIQTAHLSTEAVFGQDQAREMLQARIESVNLDAARRDVIPFLKSSRELDIWSKEFFHDVVSRIIFT